MRERLFNPKDGQLNPKGLEIEIELEYAIRVVLEKYYTCVDVADLTHATHIAATTTPVLLMCGIR